VKVRFTATAIEHLDGIYAFIAKDSPKYAQRVIDRITEKANNIAVLPHAAGIVPEYSQPDIREVFLFSYRIIYRLLSEQIDVLAVVHGAKPLPEDVADL
jgi:plasmid stabilization system protein ParE